MERTIKKHRCKDRGGTRSPLTVYCHISDDIFMLTSTRKEGIETQNGTALPKREHRARPFELPRPDHNSRTAPTNSGHCNSLLSPCVVVKGDAALAPPGITPSGSDVTAGGANSAHGHGPGTELAPPDYKGVLNQRMNMVESLN
ncbi:hypothetical protein J6590_001979 [Homalodisca vitripennis]|nr:hypothetical protein J6590_001979 [Homalodisca vitripennis]